MKLQTNCVPQTRTGKTDICHQYLNILTHNINTLNTTQIADNDSRVLLPLLLLLLLGHTTYRKTANTSWVSYSSWVSNTSQGSEIDVLIETGSQIKAGSLI